MKRYVKHDYPVEDIRRFVEPGPILLVSSFHLGRATIMTMGWHLVMEFSPSLIGCFIWSENFSRELITKSRECVFNVPTLDMAETVVDIGNCSGREVDKFSSFGLTPARASRVGAPLIEECWANFEAKLVETRLARRYSFFIFEVVKAHVALKPKIPRTIHYRGKGEFMVAGKELNLRERFRPGML